MASILSIDPGSPQGHTGIVLVGYTPDTRPYVARSFAVAGGFRGFCEWLDGGLYDTPDTVIVEQFVHFKAVQLETTPILIEGVVRFKWRDAILSPVSGKNTAMPDEVMRKLGFVKQSGDHHNDRWEALRHALRWLKNQKHIPTLRAFD